MVGTVALLHPVSVLKTVSGCFEAPLQMVYNIWLIIFGIIDSSFGFSCRNYQDLNGNSVCIPVSVTLSIGFSLMSTLSEVLFLNLIHGKKQWFPKPPVTGHALPDCKYFLSKIVAKKPKMR